MMDTDLLKERIIHGALADVFRASPNLQVVVPRVASVAPANDEEAAPEDDKSTSKKTTVRAGKMAPVPPPPRPDVVPVK